ncbi:OmpP1/FadL family transporter [Pedobacter sp. MW01-1-1]|uniref:OmpP1/FadL family transporter n=1 Tax=Pedobacter sp. MW01-1-1 TaxID=3383027 RepID=UPI003FF007D6
MKKIFLGFLVATVAATGTSYAQTYATDAFRFSQTNYGSTARFKGMAGAQIGVGGDIGSLGANPAGLGLFTKSEFNITPEFNSVSSESLFLGNTIKDSKSQLNLNNLGVVFYSPTYRAKGANKQKGVVSAVFGLGYNRNNDFFNQFTYSGTNALNSFRNSMAEQANAYGTDNNLMGDAYNSYLINYNTPGNANRYTANPNTGTSTKQNWTESRLGSTSEFNVAGALNISNKVYIGAAFSFVNARYISDAYYTESGVLNPYDEASQAFEGAENYTMQFASSKETKGSGMNIKLGMIFKPVEGLRLGFNFQTPTWMNIQDNTNEVINNQLQGFNSNNPNNNYSYTYNLRTPLKASLGGSYIIAGTALISADIDFVDYSAIRFSSDGYSDYSTINSNNAFIRDNYKSTINYRVGAEVKVSKEFSLRGGYGINGSGVKGGDDKFYQGQYFTGGLGYRVNNYYIDLAYQNYQNGFNNSPYILNDYSEPVAEIKTTRDNVFLTFGVRF